MPSRYYQYSYFLHCMLLYMVLCRSSSTLFRASRVSNFSLSLLQLLQPFPRFFSILSFLLSSGYSCLSFKTQEKTVVSSSHWSGIYWSSSQPERTPLSQHRHFCCLSSLPYTHSLSLRRLLLLLFALFSGFKYIYLLPAVATITCPKRDPNRTPPTACQRSTRISIGFPATSTV